MTVGDMSRLLAEVEVSEVDVVNVALGQTAEVTVDALGADDPQVGSVVDIATSGRRDAAQGTIRFRVKVAIDDPNPALRPAMTAKVDILTATSEDTLTVPIQAVVKRTLDFGEDMEMIAKKLSLKIMTESGVEFSDSTHIHRVEGRTVHAQREDEAVVFEDVDLIVVTTGMQSVDGLARKLHGAVPTWVVGDAKRVGNAQDAITDAYLTCREI